MKLAAIIFASVNLALAFASLLMNQTEAFWGFLTICQIWVLGTVVLAAQRDG